LEEKQKFLEEADRGVRKCGIASKYGISVFTLSTFIKEGAKTEKIPTFMK
jgi:hypothetical protein